MSASAKPSIFLRFRRETGGAAAVEFAIVVPVFLAIMMTIWEFGFAQHKLSSIRFAMENASRSLMVNNALTEAQLSTMVKTQLSSIADNNVTGGNRILSLYFSAANTPGGALAISNNWRRIMVARHAFAINVAFADGHAETVQLPDLYRLRWHSLWNPLDLPAGQTPESIKAYLVSLYKQGV